MSEIKHTDEWNIARRIYDEEHSSREDFSTLKVSEAEIVVAMVEAAYREGFDAGKRSVTTDKYCSPTIEWDDAFSAGSTRGDEASKKSPMPGKGTNCPVFQHERGRESNA